MTKISFSGTILKINGKEVALPYHIVEAFILKGIIVVFLDPDANMGKSGQYRNLIAYDPSGQKMWEAQLPTSKPSDVYWKLAKKEPLIVYSYSSYECEIDLINGRILRSEFYK